ncbi:MAG: hypothetical protein KJ060_16590, partial [Candidatus Hydrogenedentes bacterium]|nr:hypothetical protein [Candidatus Hydrogenedentota bacterium]
WLSLWSTILPPYQGLVDRENLPPNVPLRSTLGYNLSPLRGGEGAMFPLREVGRSDFGRTKSGQKILRGRLDLLSAFSENPYRLTRA